MILRTAFGFAALALVACLGGAPPQGASSPGGTSAPSSGGSCGQFGIQSSADLDACKTKCRDKARDQLQSCSGPNCQAGTITGPCLASCDNDKKSAQAASCYKE